MYEHGQSEESAREVGGGVQMGNIVEGVDPPRENIGFSKYKKTTAVVTNKVVKKAQEYSNDFI